MEDIKIDDADEKEHLWLLEQAELRTNVEPFPPRLDVSKESTIDEQSNTSNRPPTPRRVPIIRRKTSFTSSGNERSSHSLVVRQGINRSSLRRSSLRKVSIDLPHGSQRHRRRSSDPLELSPLGTVSLPDRNPRGVSRHADASRFVVKPKTKPRVNIKRARRSRSPKYSHPNTMRYSRRIDSKSKGKKTGTKTGRKPAPVLRYGPPKLFVEDQENEAPLRRISEEDDEDVEMDFSTNGNDNLNFERPQFFQTIRGWSCVGFSPR